MNANRSSPTGPWIKQKDVVPSPTKPMVPIEEQIENPTLYYEKSIMSIKKMADFK